MNTIINKVISLAFQNRYITLLVAVVIVIVGIIGLYITHTYFSVSAGVGFIALTGVAVQNGVILISYINQFQEEDADGQSKSITEAVFEGALRTQYDLRQALAENAEVYNQIPKLPFHNVA